MFNLFCIVQYLFLILLYLLPKIVAKVAKNYFSTKLTMSNLLLLSQF